MVYCTKQQEIYQESQRSDVATGNAGWPSQTQTQTQRCGALRSQYNWEPFRDTNWWLFYYSLPSRGHTFTKSIVIEMGDVSRYFKKVPGLGVDVTLLSIRFSDCCTPSMNWWGEAQGQIIVRCEPSTACTVIRPLDPTAINSWSLLNTNTKETSNSQSHLLALSVSLYLSLFLSICWFPIYFSVYFLSQNYC